MGKIFVADEVNDAYTATVTNARKLKVEEGASTFQVLSSAIATAAQSVSTGACWFKKLILGTVPGTATVLHIYDTSSSANFGGSSLTTALGTSGTNKIAFLDLSTSGISAGTAAYPKIIPFNVYCTSGLCIQVGDLGANTNLGCLKNVTVVYQA
jgi:hypothetical protein